MLRNATLRRTVASLFLLEMVGSLAAPSLSFALMGPGQPEFTSYESSGSPDMVNLSTGDLTYNVPVLEVPGPETTFSLPLTYRAGIRPEQEASWVGLGWGMNPGAIVRNVNGYPDDADGELATNSYSDPGNHGWYGGVPGILNLGWDSETGHSGSASLLGFVSASWSGGKLQSGDIVGIGAARGEGFTLDPIKLISAAATVATVGVASVGELAAGTSYAVSGAKVALQAGGAVASGVGIAAFGKSGPSGGGFNRPTVVKDHTWFRTNYWVFVNDTTKEAMFGSLNFDQMSQHIDKNFGDFANANNYGPNVFDGPTNYQNNIGRKGYKFNYRRDFTDQGNFVMETAADMQQYTDPSNADYVGNAQNPISIAHDDFTVMGPGVSGTIRPQRLDVGSLAYPRQMLAHHDKYSLVPWESYKVGFRYDNTASNTYTHTGNANAFFRPAGIDNSHWDQSQLILTDPKLYDATLNAAATRTEPSRKGLTNRRLAQGKHVDWFTNKEIADAYDASPSTRPIAEYSADVAGTSTQQIPDGYTVTRVDHQLVYTPKYKTQTTTSKNLFRRLRPENGIGAFRVTAEDGTVYHYSLPVYHLRQYGKTLETGDPAQGVAIHSTGAKGNSMYNYATAWLLTAITGPDYIDQGIVGVVDDQDLGTWVKFSYGKFSSQFKWRQPYVGTEIGPVSFVGDEKKPTNAQSFQEGAKETYYLNSVRTRTHTALFLKSPRQDGRGHYSASTAAVSNLGIDERTPASSLRLDEVVVISNPDLASLQANTGFSENTSNNASAQDGTLGGSDSFAAVFDQNDVSAGSTIRAALDQKALKRVVFNYSYRLCPGAPNSFVSPTAPPALGDAYTAANRTGKLTLESIATYGPNSVKLIPDFRFDYGRNPAYDPDKWDGFGMYNSVGTGHIGPLSGSGYHRPSEDFATASLDGAAWSLTKITNPLGSTTEIGYERDQYASVSEYYNSQYSLTDQGSDAPNGVLMGNGAVDLTTLYRVNDPIHLSGATYENYSQTTQRLDQNGQPVDRPEDSSGECYSPFVGDYVITAVTANAITLDRPPPPPDGSRCAPVDNPSYQVSYSDQGYGGGYAVIRIPVNRNGGDLRVATMTTRDESNHAYVVKYQYTNSNAAPYNGTGVLSKEPEYIKAAADDFSFYRVFDYPATPVMYGQTTVLRGNFTTPDDVDQREVYTFYMVNSAMIRATKTGTERHVSPYPFYQNSDDVALRQENNAVSVDIGLLGQAKSIRKYDRRGTLEFSTVFSYDTGLPNAEGIANQGTFSESALTSEFLNIDGSVPAVYNVNWTTKTYLPTVLHSITTTTNNVAATTTNLSYDFFTGAVLQTRLINSLGDGYRTKTVPAYTLYPGMGPKMEAVGNQHMLTQTAATYSYKENGAAPLTVLSAGIQTWNNVWNNYRLYDAPSDAYKADPAASTSIWRQHRTYAWQSPQLNPDGTYANFVDYDWTQPAQAAHWLNVGEVTLYDHYSRPLESKDLNGQYSTQKAGYDQSQVLAAARNARYTEVAYSGAEDAQTTGPSAGHFGGEVRDGGRQSNAQAHTGLYSSLLTPDNPNGFTYKAVAGDANDVGTGRAYRASAWVFDNGDATGGTLSGASLYATLNGTLLQATRVSDPSTRRAGHWYLLNLYFDLPATAAGQPLVVGCRNDGEASVYMDDFRFQPVDAPLQASVYDPATRQLTYTLDNDNLFTHYQYDAAGKMVKMSKEVLTPFGTTAAAERTVRESSYHYAQMKTPNWVDQSMVCETNASGTYTGYQHAQQQDVNTESPTYGQTRQGTSVYAPQACTP